MNQITHQDFGLFQTELLEVDFITFNLEKLSDLQIRQLADYFQSLGFNCYKKKAEKNKSRQEIYNNNDSQNKFEVEFILTVPYQKEIMQLQFPGLNANQFYQLIKQKSIQWEKLTKYEIVLSRFDLVYQRPNKPNDKIDNKEFINSSYLQFQRSHPNRKLVSERSMKGLVLKIGNRKSTRNYRIYTNKKNNSLRFEAEIKGHLIKDFHDLLIASTFEEQDFETRLSYEFFKYSFELFSHSKQPSHLDWLINRIRPLQYKNLLISYKSMVHCHYLNQLAFKQLKEKQHLVTLLRLLVYVRGLDYNTKRLRSEFRKYIFPLREFLKYNKQTPNQYQLNKLKEFFDLVKGNFVIESFSDKHYRMLVTIPEVFILKSEQNIWTVEIWIAEDLFDYLHPYLLPDFFDRKLAQNKFKVAFEIFKVYASNDIRKEFHIQEFLDNYPSILSNKQKKQIKEYFIYYLRLLKQQQKLQDQFLDLSSNQLLDIDDLNISHLKIAVFENLNIKFS
jgi:hypothetical protein